MQTLTKADLIEHYTNVRQRMAIRQLQGYVNMQAILHEKKEPPKREPKEPVKLQVPEYVGYPRVEMIKKMICSYYDITWNELTSPRRNNRLVHARQVAYYIIKNHTTLSYPQIGRKFGGRDHTTILHGFNKIKNQILKDADLNAEVTGLSNLLRDAQQPTYQTEAA
jgi:chromosomal replication initiator protein